MLTSHKLSGKYIFITGFLFTAVLGTLSHFFYEWSGNATLIGLFCPVSESAWEHMKLLVFPGSALLSPSQIYTGKRKSEHRFADPWSGILTGTTFIPIFFYTYSGILGFTVVWIDIAIFYICTGITFVMASNLYRSQSPEVPRGTFRDCKRPALAKSRTISHSYIRIDLAVHDPFLCVYLHPP